MQRSILTSIYAAINQTTNIHSTVIILSIYPPSHLFIHSSIQTYTHPPNPAAIHKPPTHPSNQCANFHVPVSMMCRIKEEPTAVVCPVIDVIDWNTFQYLGNSGEPQIGGFDWRLVFTWHTIPEHEQKRRHSPTDVIRCIMWETTGCPWLIFSQQVI